MNSRRTARSGGDRPPRACRLRDRPSSRTTMRSAITIASSRSWVTWMRGDAERALQRLDLAAQLQPHAGVEVGQRLVEQQQLRARRRARGRARRAGAGRPKAAVTLRSPSPSSSSMREHLGDALRDLARARQPAQPQAVADVLRSRHVRPERVGLEHHRDVAPLGRQLGDVAAATRDAPATAGRKPEMARSSVVLPQPDEPRSATNSPAADGKGRTLLEVLRVVIGLSRSARSSGGVSPMPQRSFDRVETCCMLFVSSTSPRPNSSSRRRPRAASSRL